MKQIAVITPVPESITSLIQNSMLRRAVDKSIVEFHVVSLRDFSEGNYRQVDDEPIGGGSGMVMMPEPLFKALDYSIQKMGDASGIRVVYPTPLGEQWTHEIALENAEVEKLIYICGHYKGVDERVIKKYVTHEYSIGDFVVTSGELPALLMIDSIVRLIPGVLNTYESAMTDSFAADLLDGPHYTRPREIEGMSVPDVLLEGHHKKIEEWRKKHRIERTKIHRPIMWKEYLKKEKSSEKENE